MSTETGPGMRTDGEDPPVRRPLPTGTKVFAGALLAVPLLALAFVATYSRSTPVLLGIPFFYWYQLLWVLLTPVFTWSAYIVISRARGESR